MTTTELRDRINRLIAALEEADVKHLTITLNDVTPEEIVEAYPEATIETFVSRQGERVSAIDSARVPGRRGIKASRHRAPTPEELADVKTRPYRDPEQSYFHGGA